MDNTAKIEAYLNKLLSFQLKEQALSEAELREIALSSGISEHEYTQIQATADACITRGRAFMKHNNWQDAIPEFEQAATLRPFQASLYVALANAYQLKFVHTRNRQAQNTALEHANRALQIQPDNHEAIRIISEIRSGEQVAMSGSTAQNTKMVASVIIIVAMLIIGAVSGLIFWAASNNPDASSYPTDDNPAIVEIAKSEDEVFATPMVALELVKNNWSEKFDLQVHSSDFSPYDNAYSYTLLANLEPKGIEVSRLSIKYDLLDNNGNTVQSEVKEIVGNYKRMTYRSGDLIPIYILKHVSNVPKKDQPKITTIKVELYNIMAEEAPQNYETSETVTLEWLSGIKPANFDLAVRARHSEFTHYAHDSYHTAEMEFENTGNRSIKALRGEVIWLDQQQNIIGQHGFYIQTATDTPPLKRGQTRITNHTWGLKDKIKDPRQLSSFRVRIVSIE